MVMRELVGGLPLEVKLLERHEFSSQTFVPLDVGRWLVVVCPHAPLGGPDVAHSRALIAGPDQGITYRMNTWHHGFTVLAGRDALPCSCGSTAAAATRSSSQSPLSPSA
jgi:ureidoglycolate lyase